MKKLILGLMLVGILSGCGSETVKTVVVDQNGNVINEKVISGNRFVRGGTLSVEDNWDYYIKVDTLTGCEYFTGAGGLSPLYDENGQVSGCRNLKKNEDKTKGE